MSTLLALTHRSKPPSNGRLCGIISLLSNVIMPASRLSHWLSRPVCEAEDPRSILVIGTFSRPLSTLKKCSLDGPKRKADPITRATTRGTGSQEANPQGGLEGGERKGKVS